MNKFVTRIYAAAKIDTNLTILLITAIIKTGRAINEPINVGSSGPKYEINHAGIVNSNPEKRHSGSMLKASFKPLFLPSLATIAAIIKNGIKEPTIIFVRPTIIFSSE